MYATIIFFKEGIKKKKIPQLEVIKENTSGEFPGSLVHGKKVPLLLPIDTLYSLSQFSLDVYLK